MVCGIGEALNILVVCMCSGILMPLHTLSVFLVVCLFVVVQGGCAHLYTFIPILQIVASSPNDLQDYTYYFVPAPWLTVKLMRLLQCFDIPGEFEL